MDEEALVLLRLWPNKKNDRRKNVLPDDKEWVHTESFGMQLLYNGIINVTAIARKYPHSTRMLLKWANDKLQLDDGD